MVSKKKKEKIRNVNTGSHYTEVFEKTEYYLYIVMLIIDMLLCSRLVY